MALFENFPYTNLHQLNLDWLVAEMKKVEDTIKYGPVVSVNGLTGEVVLYQEANVRLPDVMNPTQTNWNIFRYLNGHVYGIEFDATGNVYQIQDQYRRKLLTWADIPQDAGVISVNGKYGVVRLYGSDIQTSGDDTKTVMESIYDLDELTSTLQTISNAIKNSLAYVENTNTATHNMSSGTYVLWNNGAYKVKSGVNIAIGDTLSSSNLDPIGTKGFINDLNDSITALNSNIDKKSWMIVLGNDINTPALMYDALFSVLDSNGQTGTVYLSSTTLANLTNNAVTGHGSAYGTVYRPGSGSARFDLTCGSGYKVTIEQTNMSTSSYGTSSIYSLKSGTVVSTFTNGVVTEPWSKFGLTKKVNNIIFTPQSNHCSLMYSWDNSDNTNCYISATVYDGTPINANIRYGFLCVEE